MTAFFIRLQSDEAAATAVEYGLIAAMVVIGAMTAFTAFAGGATGLWLFIADTFVQASI